MTATERPSLAQLAHDWWRAHWTYLGRTPEETLVALLESVQSEERAFADIRLQTAVTTMEQATQAMLEAQAEIVELRAALAGLSHGIERAGDFDDDTRVGRALKDTEAVLARPQPEAILRVLRAAGQMHEAWKAWDRAEATIEALNTFSVAKTAYKELRAAVRALPEGVREVLK